MRKNKYVMPQMAVLKLQTSPLLVMSMGEDGSAPSRSYDMDEEE